MRVGVEVYIVRKLFLCEEILDNDNGREKKKYIYMLDCNLVELGYALN